jgi:hypothetical protein
MLTEEPEGKQYLNPDKYTGSFINRLITKSCPQVKTPEDEKTFLRLLAEKLPEEKEKISKILSEVLQ